MIISDEAACILARVVSFFYKKNKDTPKQNSPVQLYSTQWCNLTPSFSNSETFASSSVARYQSASGMVSALVCPELWPRLSGCASVTCRTPAGRYTGPHRDGNTARPSAARSVGVREVKATVGMYHVIQLCSCSQTNIPVGTTYEHVKIY